MKQLLSITILSYFKAIHSREITTSNALALLSKLNDFKAIHEANQSNYVSYHGLTFEDIREVLNDDITRITNTHLHYKNLGYEITAATKQNKIENKLKENSTKEIAKEIIKEILTPTISTTKLTIKEQKKLDADNTRKKLDLELLAKQLKKQSKGI